MLPHGFKTFVLSIFGGHLSQLSLYSAVLHSLRDGPCYHFIKGQFNKVTMNCLFSFKSIVKSHGKKTWEPQHNCVLSKSVIMRCVIKGLQGAQ